MPETREQMLERHIRELRRAIAHLPDPSGLGGVAGVEYLIHVRGPAGAEGQIRQWMQQNRQQGSGYTFTEVTTA